LVILSGLSFFLFISIFFAPDKVLAFYRYFIFLLGLGFFWLIVKVEYNKTKMAIVFLSGLIIQGVFAVQQFLNQGTPAFKWLGLAAHSPADLGVSVIETVGFGGVPERWLRAYGSLDHPNILGGLMAIGLIIIISVIVNHQRINNKKTDWRFITYNLSFVILSAGLIFSFSRSALVSFAFGLIVFFIFYFIKKDWLALKRIGGSAVLFVVLLSLIFINYQNLFYTRASTSTRLEAKSFSERKMYLDDSFSLIKNNWLFGVGIGNYTKALSEKDLRRPWYYLQPVHNVFLLVWAEAGIFSLLFFIALLACLFWQAIKKNNVLGLSVLAILAIIMIFDHYLWSLHFGILFFWLLIGFLFSSEREK
jgi:O-antigen ligase